MKKTKLLALASLLLVAGLVSCGGGDTTSTPASEETPAQSEQAPAQSEDVPAVSESTPAVSENTPAVSENTPAVSESTPAVSETTTPSGSYESTPALELKFTPSVDTSSGDFTETVNAGTYQYGDFEFVVATGRTIVLEDENKTVTVNGSSKSYTQRINNKSSDNAVYFTAAKAGKFVFVARSSSKTDGRTAILTDDAGASTIGEIALPAGDGSSNAPYSAYEIEFASAGSYCFQITGGASHILDFLVYYAA